MYKDEYRHFYLAREGGEEVNPRAYFNHDIVFG
jgi:hypothetical protein